MQFIGECMDSSKYFFNSNCQYFPCHKGLTKDDCNCLFCYCPLYNTECEGEYKLLKNGIKDCTNCTWVHKKENYQKIMKKLIQINKDKEKVWNLKNG